MADPQTVDALPPLPDSGGYHRMTNAERLLVVKLHDDGLTQVQIAQRLARAQSTISSVLSDFTDTTELAKRYFSAKALDMAEHVVAKGQPRDHNVALAGIGVLKGESGASAFQVTIGMVMPGMPVSPSESPQAERRSAETLTITVGSDKQSYVNGVTD